MKTPKALDTFVDVVLAYKPKPKTKAAKRRIRRKKRVHDPLAFPCQDCNAAPGVQCRNPQGRESLAYCARRLARAKRGMLK